MITIEDEAKQFSKLPTGLDNQCDRYKTIGGRYIFPSLTLWTIEKNLFYLLRNSTLKDFEPKYKMKPDYLSYDEYGTVTLASLLMFVNSIPCIEDFNLVTVVIPSFQSIVSICSDNFPEKEISKLMEVPW